MTTRQATSYESTERHVSNRSLQDEIALDHGLHRRVDTMLSASHVLVGDHDPEPRVVHGHDIYADVSKSFGPSAKPRWPCRGKS
jgi:hypothetical protein